METTPLEDARAALARIDEARRKNEDAWRQGHDQFNVPYPMFFAGLEAPLRELIAEHERLIAEMHQRELHHFETEQMLVQAGLDPDAAPPTDDECEALARYIAAPEATDAKWAAWLDAVSRYPDSATASVHRHALHKAGLAIAAGFRRQGPITDAQVEAAGSVFYENWSEWDRDEPYARGHIQLVRDALEAARDA